MHLIGGLLESTLLGLVGLALITAILLRRSGRYFRRTKNRPALARTERPEPGKSPGHRLDAPEAFRRWEVEMHEIAREHSARLDNKIRILQCLIGEAEQAAARLEAALERGRAETERNSPNDAAPGRGEANRRAAIHAMAEAGFDVAEIARRSGLPAEEVELILQSRGAE